MEHIEQFRNTMLNDGISPPDEIIPDGRIQRFHIEGDRNGTKNGWYVFYSDIIPAGVFGSWKTGEETKWSCKGTQQMSEDEMQEYQRRMKAAKTERMVELQKEWAVAAKKATEILQAANGDPASHPYATKKKVYLGDLAKRGQWPQRNWADALLVPIYNEGGKVVSVQAINEDGIKDLLAGGRKKGCFYPIGKIRDASTILIGEGLATVAAGSEATDFPGVVAVDAGNLLEVGKIVREIAPEAAIMFLADDDQGGDNNSGIDAATKAARTVNGKIAFPGMNKKADFWDLWCEQGADAVVGAIKEAEGKQSRINIVNALDFMTMTFPPRENILAPWLPSQGLTMIYAPRGIGKTHLSLGIGYAVSSGGGLFHWHASRPRGVLFIDGEMPGAVLQERLARIAVSSDCEPQAPLRIITPDLQPSGMLDLSQLQDQAEIEPYLEGISLLIIDNISTLCRSGRENEAESWLPVQEWALRQRAAGRSVLFIHHSGKGGQQRGTSRREDVLDTTIALRYPGDYSPDQGATFEVHFEKARGIYGEDTKPFEARLTTTQDGKQEWTTKNLEQSTAEKVAALLADGIPQKEIAELLGITKGAVSKARKKADAMRLIMEVSQLNTPM